MASIEKTKIIMLLLFGAHDMQTIQAINCRQVVAKRNQIYHDLYFNATDIIRVLMRQEPCYIYKLSFPFKIVKKIRCTIKGNF